MSQETGPKAAVSSVVESVKGRAKEAAGAATGDESLRKEGRAQQDKAESVISPRPKVGDEVAGAAAKERGEAE